MPGGRDEARDTATFTPYFWEAYNEIVEPRRFDHYLIRRWAKDLGPLGFLIVKALRDRCYHNPLTGVLRDSCEVDANELADSLGVGRATLFRELGKNETLQLFVQREQGYRLVNGKPQQTKNRYRVSMDDPVHPEDMERYDMLRAQKERERFEAEQQRIAGLQTGKRKQLRDTPQADAQVSKYASTQVRKQVLASVRTQSSTYLLESQNETQSGFWVKPAKNMRVTLESHFETQGGDSAFFESQNETPDTQCLQTHSDTPETTSLLAHFESPIGLDLPSGDLLTKESLTGQGRPVCPPIYPPRGREEELWETVLSLLATRVNKPTFETHLRTLELQTIDGDTVALSCPSAFTLEWLEKRYIAVIAESFSSVIGHATTVKLIRKGK